MGSTWVNPDNIGLGGNANTGNYGLNSTGLFGSGISGTNAGLTGLSGLAGFFPTPSSGNSSTSSSLSTGQQSSGTSNVSGTSGSTTGYGAAGTSVINQILPQLSSLLAGTNLSTSYLPQQTQQINQNSQLQQQALNNIMASRGLGTSPVAATAAAGVDANRVGQITNLQQQVPLLQQQLNSQNLNTAGGILSRLPTSTTGTTSQTGTSNTTSNTNQNGQSNTTTQQNSGGGLGGLFGGIASALASVI